MGLPARRAALHLVVRHDTRRTMKPARPQLLRRRHIVVGIIRDRTRKTNSFPNLAPGFSLFDANYSSQATQFFARVAIMLPRQSELVTRAIRGYRLLGRRRACGIGAFHEDAGRN